MTGREEDSPRVPAADPPPALEVRGIDKWFGPVHANKSVSLAVRKGTIHGIIGENGAGKSTLMSIVYAAAGGTGVGVYQAAKDSGKLAIGVDSNQNYIHPGTMLTSMVKRVDVAVYDAFATAREGTWKGGLKVLGLAEDGVGYAIDQHNRALISAEVEKRVEKARNDIIAGTLKVTDYTQK